MKVSNETKVGALTVISVTLLVLGFNFLKGKSLFGKSHNLFAKYTNVQGLANSNPVLINGLEVGIVYSITTDKNMKVILVNMNITKDVNIPRNSIAVIKPNPLGTNSIEIRLGDSNTYIPNNDTITTEPTIGIFNEVYQKIDPVLASVRHVVNSLDSVLMNINSMVDPAAKNNISGTLGNLNKMTASLTLSSASLETLLNTQTGALAKTMSNLSSFTSNLVSNNDTINHMLSNLEKTSSNFSKLDMEKTLTSLNTTIAELKATIGKLNSSNGTAGLLLNDTRLYNNLAATANKVNVLLDDLRTNPKRYVSISLFGRKNKEGALMVPLPDTLHAPYLPK